MTLATTTLWDGKKSCPNCAWREDFLSDDSVVYCSQCCFPLVVLGNRYELLRVLASGGNGKVFLAEDLDTGYEVAVKVPKARAGVEESFVQQSFLREIQIARAMSEQSEHTARYLAHGCEPGFGPYYVMEYLRGQSLHGYLRRNPTRCCEEVLRFFERLCKAMEEIHGEGVVHRDLKPENIFLLSTRRGEDFEVKVLDFGIASTEMEQPGELTQGTPPYMAPEQCVDGAVDHRADIYAMGVLLYEMLTGSHPFHAERATNVMSLLYAHLCATPQRMGERRRDLKFSEALEAVVAKALAKQPEERYGSASELLSALWACPEARVQTAEVVDTPLCYVSTFSSANLNAFIAHRELEAPACDTQDAPSIAGLIDSICFA